MEKGPIEPKKLKKPTNLGAPRSNEVEDLIYDKILQDPNNL